MVVEEGGIQEHVATIEAVLIIHITTMDQGEGEKIIMIATETTVTTNIVMKDMRRHMRGGMDTAVQLILAHMIIFNIIATSTINHLWSQVSLVNIVVSVEAPIIKDHLLRRGKQPKLLEAENKEGKHKVNL